MMLNSGAYGKERILSRLSVELMTTDQLTTEQKAASPFFENFWDSRGWGLGVSIVTRRDDVAGVPGRYGWDGAFSTYARDICRHTDAHDRSGGDRPEHAIGSGENGDERFSCGNDWRG